jgi:transcriptional regulator with XRE-family HTH domain
VTVAVYRGIDENGQRLGIVVVKNTLLQMRLNVAGMTQKRLAEILGVAENTVSRQMKGDWDLPGYVSAVLAAREIMSPDLRDLCLAEIKRRAPQGKCSDFRYARL